MENSKSDGFNAIDFILYGTLLGSGSIAVTAYSAAATGEGASSILAGNVAATALIQALLLSIVMLSTMLFQSFFPSRSAVAKGAYSLFKAFVVFVVLSPVFTTALFTFQTKIYVRTLGLSTAEETRCILGKEELDAYADQMFEPSDIVVLNRIAETIYPPRAKAKYRNIAQACKTYAEELKKTT